MAGPRFFSFVIGGALPVTAAANWLATAWDQNGCFDASTPGVARIEEVARRWLKSLGREGLARLIDRNCAQARHFANGLRAAGFEILNDVVLNKVVVSFGDDARTRRVIDAVQRDGTCWAGVTVWQQRTAMRISVSPWATTDDDVERSLAAIVRRATSAP